MRRTFRIIAAILAFGGVAACGDSPLEQAVLGAGAGLGTAAVLDGNLATGAAIGAAGNLLYCQTGRRRC